MACPCKPRARKSIEFEGPCCTAGACLMPPRTALRGQPWGSQAHSFSSTQDVPCAATPSGLPARQRLSAAAAHGSS